MQDKQTNNLQTNKHQTKQLVNTATQQKFTLLAEFFDDSVQDLQAALAGYKRAVLQHDQPQDAYYEVRAGVDEDGEPYEYFEKTTNTREHIRKLENFVAEAKNCLPLAIITKP